ncbi:MAG: hypothetical protein WC343_11445 [Bacilli bacterium]|jgi:hypothetical protein
MKVELEKKDLIALVNGTSPYYNAFEIPLVKENGYYMAGHVEKWCWNSLKELTEEELWELYNICKNSWK